MSRHSFSRWGVIRVIVIAVLTLSLPFIHTHPQVIHSDSAGEHTHPAVVHTLFSPEADGRPAVPSNGIQYKEWNELFRVAIGLDIVPERLTTPPAPPGPDSAGVSSESSRAPIVTSNPLLEKFSVTMPAPWAGSPLSVRAPPHHSFS
jgi:hypothetical protein